ncbi:hypothetical protein [Halorhabdus salina]|uniref:hypothetical protein n=1 Tax=Halorhabdus salina TaxID=2750670 RepID=UPI0015EF3D46|nr:hypothetical protein [Halorhabdus salina]
MTLQTLAVTCRACRAERVVTIDDRPPFPETVSHHCRVCNRDRPLVVGRRDGRVSITTTEGSV